MGSSRTRWLRVVGGFVPYAPSNRTIQSSHALQAVHAARYPRNSERRHYFPDRNGGCDLAERFRGRGAGRVFVADDLGAWLVALLADRGRRRLTTVVLGSDQERALRQAARAAVQFTAQ